ncbi:MAG: glycosyltransferase family 4 protein [Planctomycetaceae bacterium]|nr:glycosyltransferase family 4 protein [Planctomycetaceae bacterium]
MKRVAFVTSHPIQYQIPVFRELTQRGTVDFTAVFAQIPDSAAQGSGFGVSFEWDVPLLEGYKHHVLENVAKNPSLVEYAGCDTPGVREYIREQQFDAVIVNGWVVKTCWQALRACRTLGIPCIVRGEANHLRERAWWKRLLQRFLVRSYSGYLYIGEANKAFYKSYGVLDAQLFPCRYCIENKRFAAASEDSRLRLQARERWGIPADVVCYLFSGKFETKKHPVELINAFREAHQQGMQAHLLMVGDGELRAECEAIVRSANLPVTFAGFVNQSQMPEAYLACDCLVLPSDAGETWGLVTNEAMACGRPALVSDLVGCREDLILEGETGHSFKFGDWTALTQRLMQLSQEADKLISMGCRAKGLVQEYSPENAAIGIESAVAALGRQSDDKQGNAK